jgi:hypothetical protein
MSVIYLQFDSRVLLEKNESDKIVAPVPQILATIWQTTSKHHVNVLTMASAQFEI